LELISYRSVLERGFALVRAADGTVRRRAASIETGEALTLTFADGEVPAQAGEGAGQAQAGQKETRRRSGLAFLMAGLSNCAHERYGTRPG
jgi:exodeoxyribonuclease VII large subunit